MNLEKSKLLEHSLWVTDNLYPAPTCPDLPRSVCSLRIAELYKIMFVKFLFQLVYKKKQEW